MAQEADQRAGRATGSASREETELFQAEEPDVRGTLFLTGLLLMVIFGFWTMMFLVLLER